MEHPVSRADPAALAATAAAALEVPAVHPMPQYQQVVRMAKQIPVAAAVVVQD